jgi:diguanylate cyclase (GGDEF)-like protein
MGQSKIVTFIKYVVANVIATFSIIYLLTLENGRYIDMIVLILTTLILIFLYKLLKTNQQLRENYEKTQSILDIQDSITFITDGVELQEVNKKFLDFFGMKDLASFKNYYQCLQPLFIYSPEHQTLFQNLDDNNWIETLLASNQDGITVSLTSADAEPRNFVIHIKKMRGRDLYVVTLVDITQLTIDSMHYQYQASHDMLTGCYNRVFFKEVLQREFSNILRHHTKLSILRIDVDDFKAFNNKHGNLTGDKALKHIAMILTQSVRAIDTVVRDSGDSFIILLSQTQELDAIKVAFKIKEAIAKQPLTELEGEQLTCSFGVSEFKEYDKSTDDGLKRSQMALSYAKGRGKNRVEVDSAVEEKERDPNEKRSLLRRTTK